MNSFLLVIIAVLLAIITGFLVPLLIEVRRTVASLRKTVEEKVDPVLEELRPTMTNMQHISDNVNEVTSHAKEFSKSIGDIGHTISVVNGLIEGVGSSTAIKVVSLRAGIGAALGYLLKNLLRKGDVK